MIMALDHLIDRPRFLDLPMLNPLSEVLRSLRLKGGVFLEAALTAPWAVSSYLTAEHCRPILANPAHMMSCHFVVEGRMQASIGGEPAVEIGTGGLLLVPRNDVHVLASEPGITPVDGNDLVMPTPGGGLARIVHGGGGARTRLVCGFLGTDDLHHPLIDALPRCLTADTRQAASRPLLEASFAFAAAELHAGRIASSDVLAQLSEMLFVEAVHRYVAALDATAVGWLGALKDPQIGRALALLHRDIAMPWTADHLAREVGMSRSAFVERFTTHVGVPPIRYLTRWRMETAKIQLRRSAHSVAQVAHAVGYDSDEAFSRAFKREIGLAPAAWRAQRAGGGRAAH
jgi:AraC-like DNA-binding protein